VGLTLYKNKAYTSMVPISTDKRTIPYIFLLSMGCSCGTLRFVLIRLKNLCYFIVKHAFPLQHIEEINLKRVVDLKFITFGGSKLKKFAILENLWNL